jgi:general L-amino acid transport system substrate-binding protein
LSADFATSTLDDARAYWAAESPTLARVLARGELLCAHIDFTLGHSNVKSRTEAQGMEPDLCRGLAAALGLPGGTHAARFHVMLAPAERFPLLQSGGVDVVFALTSKTVGRDLLEKGSFSVPYFQDQHNIMYRSDAGIGGGAGGASLRGKTLCATKGTTNPNVLRDYLAATLGEDGMAEVTVKLVDEDAHALAMMRTNECQGFVNDDSVVAGYVHTEKPPSGVTYELASWPGAPFARAPFSAVTLDGDTVWAALVDWYVQGFYLAEMYGVTGAEGPHDTDHAAVDPTLPGEARRLLGLEGVNGQRIPLDMRAAVKAIGNYAELYERNFGAFLPRSRANTLYQNGGSVFPGGFR